MCTIDSRRSKVLRHIDNSTAESEVIKMEDNTKLITLLKKLKALADRGIGGEKLNAERMLRELMQKHNISIEDIEGEKKQRFDFDVPFKYDKLFWQIVSNVIIDWNGRYVAYKHFKRKFGIEMTHAEHLEIEAKFDFYCKDFEEQMKIFTSAYILKNKLTPTYSEERRAIKDREDEETETPAKERARLFKVRMMIEGVDRAQYLKRLK